MFFFIIIYVSVIGWIWSNMFIWLIWMFIWNYMFISRSEFIIKIPPCGNPVGLFVCLFVCVCLCTICLHMWMRVCRVCLLFSQPPSTSPAQIHTYHPFQRNFNRKYKATNWCRYSWGYSCVLNKINFIYY